MAYRSKLQSILLFLFFLLLPTQLGKHFFFDFSYISGVRIDYLAPTLYVTDLLVAGLVLLNLKAVFSPFKTKTGLLFILLALINITFAFSPFVAIYKTIKLFEMYAIYRVIKQNQIKPLWLLTAFLISSSVELVLSVWQFNAKHAIQEVFYYLGERYLNLQTPGIAKSILNGVEILRPYGTFSHPNSLAGFYLVSYFFFLIDNRIAPFIVRRNILLLLCTLLVFISFSKIAIATFLLLNIFYLFTLSNISCKLCKFGRTFILFLVTIAFFLPQGDPASASNRMHLLLSSFVIFVENILTGVGLGNYLYAQQQFPISQSYFFLQPVHNIFALLFAETGLITGIIIVVYLCIGLKRMHKQLGWFLVLLPIIITGMADHYWFTLQQNILLLPAIVALVGLYQAPKKTPRKN